jgi:hypothetical protein
MFVDDVTGDAIIGSDVDDVLKVNIAINKKHCNLFKRLHDNISNEKIPNAKTSNKKIPKIKISNEDISNRVIS